MTAPVSTTLAELESVIERGLDTFVEVGTALAAIRDGKHYKASGHSTFEDYCKQRWGFTKQHAGRLMRAADLVEIIGSETEPIGSVSESQLRPLAPLKDQPEQAKEAWAEAVQEAGGAQPTAKQVEEVVTRRRHRDAVAEFPFLSPEQSPGVPPVEAVRIADGLRSVPEGPERDQRIEAAKVWHRRYSPEATEDRAALNEQTTAYGRAAEMVACASRFVVLAKRLGDAETIGVAEVEPFERQVWAETIQSAIALLTEMQAANETDRSIRRVK